MTIEIKIGNCSHLFVFAVSIRSEKSRFLKNCLDQRATLFEVVVLQMSQLQLHNPRAFDSGCSLPEAKSIRTRRLGSLHIVSAKLCSKPCCLFARCQLKGLEYCKQFATKGKCLERCWDQPTSNTHGFRRLRF